MRPGRQISTALLLLISIILPPAGAGHADLITDQKAQLSAESGTLLWNTFIGGAADSSASDITVDEAGIIYVAGSSWASWGTPVNPYAGGGDVLVASLDSNGTPRWNTFLGGTTQDSGVAIAADGDGNVYVTGQSTGTWGSPQNGFSGSYETFAAKLNSSGEIVWNTFLGSSDSDTGFDIAVDVSGNSYVTGWSWASWGTPVRLYSGLADAFVVRLDAEGNVVWSTFLGGGQTDVGFGIAADPNGGILVTGDSQNSWGSPGNPYSGSNDIFVARLQAASGELIWNTFLGGSAAEYGEDLTLDGSGAIYLTGSSNESWGTPVNAFSGNMDAFVARLESSGALAWNTFLGGDQTDQGFGIAIDRSGNLYVRGASNGSWGSPLNDFAGAADVFVAGLDGTGALLWNTFAGGLASDSGMGMAVSRSGEIHIAGGSDSSWGMPLNPFTPGPQGHDAFIAKLAGALHPVVTISGNAGTAGAILTYNVGELQATAADAQGNYVISVPDGWSGTVTPSKTGYRFEPIHREYTDLTLDHLSQDYIAITGLKSASIAAQDGWILESTETSGRGWTANATANTLIAGDNAQDKQYRSILSFNTGSLPNNAVITAVTLKLKAAGLPVGTNPFLTHGNLLADVRTGAFSGSAALQLQDFQTLAGKNAVMVFTNNPVNRWYSKMMRPENFVYINKTGPTQFRLRFAKDDNDDLGADLFKFYSGDALTASLRPQLIIQYYVP